jgi:hypothetical protein
MRRLPAVAIGVAALCALATAAEARAERMRLGAHDGYRPYSEGDWESAAPRPPRRSARAGKRRTAADRPGRRQTVRNARSSRPNRMVRATLLERIEAQFGHVGIISTCRPGAVIAGSGRPSRHASGNAIDFNAPGGRKSEVVRWLIANHRAGGVMTYSDMNHIHVDIGHHFVALGAASGGGRRWR